MTYTGLPTLREELDRKTFDTMQWLTEALTYGKITDAQFSTGVDALFMAVNGLVGEAFCEVVTTAAELVPVATPVRRVVAKASSTVVVTWFPDEPFFTTSAISAGGKKVSKVEMATPANARNSMSKLVDGMTLRGWEEI
jgi:hypothetical protein